MKKYIFVFLTLLVIASLLSLSISLYADGDTSPSFESTPIEDTSAPVATTAPYTFETAGRYYNVHMKGMPAWIPVVMIIIILLFLAMFLIFANRIKFLNEYHPSQEEKKDSKEENSDNDK